MFDCEVCTYDYPDKLELDCSKSVELYVNIARLGRPSAYSATF